MKLFNQNNKTENILNEYYEIKINHLRQNIPSLPVINIIGLDTTPGKRLFFNTAFTCGIVIMSGIVLLTAGNQSELTIVMEKAIENTNAIEHIRSGSINMFEILSKSFM